MKRFVGAASGVILLFCTLACDPQAPVDQSELGKKSATLTSVEVAAAKALASDEKLVHSVAKHFPVTKQTVYLLSGRKADSDRVRKVAVRANGTEVDLIALKAAEKKAHRAKYGAVNQRLANKLGGQGAKTVPLHVVYDAPPLPPTPIGGSAAEWAKYDATIRSLFKNAPSKAVGRCPSHC